MIKTILFSLIIVGTSILARAQDRFHLPTDNSSELGKIYAKVVRAQQEYPEITDEQLMDIAMTFASFVYPPTVPVVVLDGKENKTPTEIAERAHIEGIITFRESSFFNGRATGAIVQLRIKHPSLTIEQINGVAKILFEELNVNNELPN